MDIAIALARDTIRYFLQSIFMSVFNKTIFSP